MAVLNTESQPSESLVAHALKAFRQYWFVLIPLVLVLRFLYYKLASPLRKYPGPFLASGSRAWKGRSSSLSPAEDSIQGLILKSQY